MNAPAELPRDWNDALSCIEPPRPDAHFLPGELYVSPDVLRMEKSRIFMKNWLCVAREEEVAKPGDYMTLRIVGEPVVVARDADGKVVSYVNMCLHRGVEVVQGCGNAKRFNCPYHAWTYDTAGKLIGTPLVPEVLADNGEQRMRPLRTATWRGWIFVNFDLSASPFEEYIKPFEEDLWYYRTGECRIADKLVFDVPCNWKFVAENISDYYHLKAVHGASSGQFYQLGKEELPLRGYPSGGSSVVFDSSLRTQDTILPFPQLPWLKEGAFSAKGAIFPNVNFWCGLDSLRMWHIWPQGTDRAQAVCYVLMPEASFSVPDFAAKLEKYRRYVTAIIDEDKLTLTSLQRAASSDFLRPGRVTHLEAMVHHLMRHYAKVMAA